MSVDTCIITKYSLSEREKDLKRAFFSKKNLKNPTDADSNLINQPQAQNKTNFIFPENEEIIKKIVDQNLYELKKFENNLKLKNNSMIENTQGGVPLNLVYSQNKILERNVDILHETQRSLHDLLIYNLRKDKEKDKSRGMDKNNSYENYKIFFDLISPLTFKIEELKNSMNQIQMTTSNKNSNMNEKIKDFESKHNEFKENSQKFQTSLNLIENNKQLNRDAQILKAIEDLKNSINHINTEMNKMENEFNINMKRIIEENERSKIRNLLGGVNNSVSSLSESFNKLNNARLHTQSNKKNSESQLDYVDYQKELLDINLRKEELFNEFKSNKISIPNLSKIITPKEKINFSYKLDFEDESNCYSGNYQSNKSTKIMQSASYCSDKDSENEKSKSGKNIFLNNLSQSINSRKNIKNTRGRNEEILINPSVVQRSKSKEKHVAFAENSKQIYIQDDTKVEDRNNPLSRSLCKENPHLSEKEDKNIIERMQEVKEKMKNYIRNFDESDSNPGLSINVNSSSTKNNTSNMSSEPSSAKYLKSSSALKIFNQKLDKIEENKHNKKEETIFKENLIRAQYETNERNKNNQQIRQEIKAVDCTPIEKKKTDTLHDLILKLCVEKMIQDRNKNIKDEKKNSSFNLVEKPKLVNISDESQLKKVVENLLIDNFKNLMRNKKKLPIQKDIEIIKDPNFIEKLNEENLKRENDVDKYLKDILTRFEAIEKTISEKKEEPIIEKEMVKEVSNLNVEDIVNKISDKIKSNMQINIHLSNPYEKKISENNNNLKFNHESLQIEAVIKQSDKEQEHSTYSHPFTNTKRGNFNEIKDEVNIPLPYIINLDDYDVSSSITELEISKSHRLEAYPKNFITNKENQNRKSADVSISEGQINSSITDKDTSRVRDITNRTDITSSENGNYYFKNIRVVENLQDRISNLDMKNNPLQIKVSSEVISYHDRDNEEDDISSSSIDNYSNKHIVNINDNEELKKFNLFNSEEFNRFQKKFKQETLFKSLPKLYSDRGQNLNSLRLLNFKNDIIYTSSSYDHNKQAHSLNNNNFNPNILSFGNFVSNRSNQINNTNSHSSKLIKVSNEEIENLVKRQNDVNDKLKKIARNNKTDNNTISEIEMNSEMTTLKQREESDKSQFNYNNKYEHNEKKYKTDESSFDDKSYREHSEY